ncbi:hypothetical protein MMC11_000536 [Xylographa trunciseda]|nr:hypothetical protein [Xylographa trunciseda]
MSDKAILRITREIGGIQRSNTDLSIAVACHDSDVRSVKALIIGPSETPYEFGFFEFAVRFPQDYPDKAPSVTATTTNGGRCRFNPNIYSQGKVCLSILGTWRGERGEEWSSAQGLESILISIQSLMSSNPYENEPGYETARSAEDKKNIKNYVAKIRHETLRISIITRLEGYLGIYADGTVAEPPPVYPVETAEFDEDIEESNPTFEPFKDLCKRRFLWYYESYLLSIDSAAKQHTVSEAFKIMPFEGGSNTMNGIFNYPELRRRITLVRRVLDDETARWAVEGQVLMDMDTSIAANLKRQFEQLIEVYKKNDMVTLDIDLVHPGNPFAWLLTYFGRPMTQLDGGMFKIRVAISPRFPEEQPRVTFETPLFHHRIAKDGTLCYFAKRPDDLQSHVDAIVEAIEDEHPPYDPRTLVHPEASKLFWGSEADKKLYNRQLRRAVQRSTE